jgi:hypothetical protein
MLGEPDMENIENISAKLTRNYRELTEMLSKRAIEQGAIRLHPTSAHFFAENPKHICAYLANGLINKYIPTVSALCGEICYTVKIDLIAVVTIWAVNKKQLALARSKNSDLLRTKHYLILLYREMYDPALINNFMDNLKLITMFGKQGFTSILKSGSGTPAIFGALQEEIFVGAKAFNFYLNEPITDTHYEVISANVNGTVKKLKKIFPKLVAREFESPVLNDFWLKTTEITDGGRPVCTIYNSAEYELIPFIKADVRIGALYVVTRFILIKNLFMKLRAEKPNYTMHDRLIANVLDIKYIIPPIENYYGTYISIRALFSKCERDKDYKPLLAKKTLGRLIYF